MANKIAINDEDFTSLEENLIAKHKSIIELVGNVVKQLQDLSRRDGEFYTDSISPKVQLLCDELNDAKSSMEEIYSAHTDIISSFKSAVADLETNNIHVNSDSVISIVGATIKGIENIQEDVNDAYSSLIDLLSDASGEEVDALREQLETENNLAIALCNTLTKFSNSIRFAASEFTELDSTGASQMGNK